MFQSGSRNFILQLLSFFMQLFTVLWLESRSGMCAKLQTVAASNNRVHLTRSLSSSPLARIINCSPASQALLEVTHQDHCSGITLLLLVRTTYIWCCSSHTFCSWWTVHSAQRQPRGCNNCNIDQVFRKI